MHKMNHKKIFIGILLLSFAFLSFSFVSAGGATNLQQFLDSVPITVTINQDYSQVDFSLDTTGAYFDHQTIDVQYETITGVEFDISKILADINAVVEIPRNSDTIKFTNLSITDLADINIKMGSSTLSGGLKGLTGVILGFNNVSIDLENMSDVNSYLDAHPIPVASDRRIVFTKSGTEYGIWQDEGYGSIREGWKDEIRGVISKSVQQINIKSILEDILPMVENEPEFQAILNELNTGLGTNFSVDSIDLSALDLNPSFSNLTAVQLEDGNYTIPVTVTNSDGTPYTKNVLLVIQGIQNDDSLVYDPLSNMHIPTKPEVARYLIGIRGLDSAVILLFDDRSLLPFNTLPSNTRKDIKYLNINGVDDSVLGGTIEFKVPIGDVVNPSRIGLYLLESDGTWTGLLTIGPNLNNGFYEYSATTPHFSTFMIMETVAPSSRGGGGRQHALELPPATISSPTESGPTPIDAGPTPPRVGGGITGAIIGALTSPGGLVFLFFVLIGIIAVALVIRNVGGNKEKKELNEKGDQYER